MPDYTICTNDHCALNYNCWRYGMPRQADKANQSYQKFDPVETEDNYVCDFFTEYPDEYR